MAAALCLVLAFYCIVAAGVTLGAQTASGEPDSRKLPESPRQPLPLLIPVIFVIFMVVVAAVTRRARAGSAP